MDLTIDKKTFPVYFQFGFEWDFSQAVNQILDCPHFRHNPHRSLHRNHLVRHSRLHCHHNHPHHNPKYEKF